MAEVLFEAKGVNGQIELLSDKIRIKRKGLLSLMTQGLKWDKEILLAQVSSIQFKKAGGFTNGYIQFAFVGGQDRDFHVVIAQSDNPGRTMVVEVVDSMCPGARASLSE